MEKGFFNLSDNVNMLAFIGAAAIILVTVFVAGKYIKQIRDDKASGELTGDDWDGIGEYKNPLPIGWSIMFILTIAWAVWYMVMGYPLNSYSQIGEYNEEVATYNENYKSKWANPSKEELVGMGGSVFLLQCAPCHGATGNGIEGKAADLRTWGTEQAIIDTIKKGSKGLGFAAPMPPDMVTGEDVKAVAAYVAKNISAIKSTKNEDLVAKGEALWPTCAACHGQEGKGIEGVGPNIATYGGPKFIAYVLEQGKNGDIGKMPKFDHGLLPKIQKLAVGTYITEEIKEK